MMKTGHDEAEKVVTLHEEDLKEFGIEVKGGRPGHTDCSA